ncbi:septum formation initiator family protein [Clostridiaceae bacterium OttesenSCG-928-D20]|nr:septum formation initiator family protein [Clostridiaceae bacterium OttesenSCG-928-D20]
MKRVPAQLTTKIVIAALILFAIVGLITLQGNLAEAREFKAALSEKAEALALENARLEYGINNAENPETLEEIARDELGLIMPGEKIFIDENN